MEGSKVELTQADDFAREQLPGSTIGCTGGQKAAFIRIHQIPYICWRAVVLNYQQGSDSDS
jgi:hypothetical protein